jgi:ABC-2 type transport system permease protein
MRKLWLVAKQEYLKRVRKRSFLLSVLGIPALMVGVSVLTALIMMTGVDNRPLGYVDHTGFLDTAVVAELQAESRRFVDIRAYPDEDAARAALEEERIQAYYVVPEDYRENPELTLMYWDEAPDDEIQEDFTDFISASLIYNKSEDVRTRINEGPSLTVRSVDGRRELSGDNILGVILPFVASFFLYFAIAISGGYMLQAITDEKENRTMEIVATSLAPRQLIGGKALGLMGVVLTQILIWVAALVVSVFIASQFFEAIRMVTIPWGTLFIVVLFFLPTFALISGIMTAIGAAVTEQQQGQQVAGIVNMLFIFPVFFSALLFTNPNHPIIVVLTLFPTSSFITVLMRWSFGVIPLWQLAGAWVLVMASAAGAIWTAARVFRMGMLRYGQRLSLNTILTGLRE